MQKIITISFLVIYLFGNTEIGQLVNIPKLINHYKQHKKINTSVSFIGFLNMHYLSDDGTTIDDNEDNQLPFKQLHRPLSDNSFEVPLFASFNSNHSFLLLNNLELFNTVSPKSGYLFKQLQPPDLFS